MLQHEERNKFFPGSGWGWMWVGDPDRGLGKKQPGGWVYQILPYLEQQGLFELGRTASRTCKRRSRRPGLQSACKRPCR